MRTIGEVKWIKIASDMFNNRKIKQIESLPDGDTIIVIWLKLLCLAGNVNNGGWVYFSSEIPYTDQMLSTEFNKPLTTIQFALSTFEKFGMIEIIDSILHISNWEKYQNVEGLEKIREQNRLRKQKQREREKIALPSPSEQKCHVTSHGTVTQGHATDIDIDIDKDKNYIVLPKGNTRQPADESYHESLVEENPPKALKIPYQQIADSYNSICKDLPTVRELSAKRKKAIKARFTEKRNLKDFLEVFNKAQASDFLSGRNGKWHATFDWLINGDNMLKVLEGNYDNGKANKPRMFDADQSVEELFGIKEGTDGC